MIRKFSSVVCVLLLSFGFYQPTDTLDEICKAVSSGNAEKVAVYFGPKVEVSFGVASDGKLAKADAEKALKDFFIKNPVKSFSIQHRGPKSNGTSFAIGQMLTTQGASYRVTIYVKENAGQSTIQELKFEKN